MSALALSRPHTDDWIDRKPITSSGIREIGRDVRAQANHMREARVGIGLTPGPHTIARLVTSFTLLALAIMASSCESLGIDASAPRTHPTTSTIRSAPPTTTVGSRSSEPTWMLAVSFATPRDGAVLYARGATFEGPCTMEASVSTDRGRSWQEPIVLGRSSSCGPASLALAPNGTGWAVAAQRLWAMSDGWRTWRVDSKVASILGTGAKRLVACSVDLDQSSVWVAACPAVLSPPTLLLASTNGTTWSERAVQDSSAGEAWGGETGYSGATMAMATPQVGALIGCIGPCRSAAHGVREVDVSVTHNDGRTWIANDVCGQGGGQLIADTVRYVYVACLGVAGGGAQTIQLFASGDQGRSWRLMCDNGDWETHPPSGACPPYGGPTSLIATADGTLLMGLGRAGVEVSTDGGAKWRFVSEISGGSGIDLSSVGNEVWAVSPSGIGVFFSRNDGRTWVNLPVDVNG